MNPKILTLDVGTTAVKVSLFSEQLEPLGCTAEEYPLDVLQDERVECAAETYLDAIRAGLTRLRTANGQTNALSGISAICITTQGETLLPVDENGLPLHPAVVWLDARADEQAEKLAAQLESSEFYRRTGLPELGPSLPLAKLAWFREEQPELYEKTRYFLLLEDYLLFWLTGRFVTEKSLQCSTGWFDILADDWWPEAFAAAGIQAEKLPEALPCGVPAGRVQPIRAAELGISPDALVVTGAMDQTAAALGAGCTHEGVVTETTGTALVMAAYAAHPADAERAEALPSRITVYRHAIDGAYLYLPIGNTGGMALTWFRDNFCPDCTGRGGYAKLDELASSVPPGSNGLVALPHLSGCVNPDNCPDARAVFFGAGMNTSRADFIRSILESIGFLLRDFLGMLNTLGVHVEEVRSLGGGSRSTLWEQIKADTCGIPFLALDNGEAASLGAAMLARKGLLADDGLYAPGAPAGTYYLPNAENRAAYEKGYQTYVQLYQAVRPLF